MKCDDKNSLNFRFPKSTASKYQRKLRSKFQEQNVRKYQKKDVKISLLMFPEKSARNFPKQFAHRTL